MKNQIKSTKTLNYVIWGSVIFAGLYLLYRRTDLYKQRKLNSFAKKYPGWIINDNKKTASPFKMYQKSFKALKSDGSLDFEYWLVYYNNGIVRIYLRGKDVKFILEGTWPNDTTIKITKGYKEGQTVKGKTINEMLSKIFDQKITDI